MSRLYVPPPTAAWRSDSVGSAFVKIAATAAFLAAMSVAAGLVQFLEIMRG
jgi:hypothetical protein